MRRLLESESESGMHVAGLANGGVMLSSETHEQDTDHLCFRNNFNSKVTRSR